MSRLVTFGETALRLTPPDRDRLETASELRMRADGTESNVAVAASRLGLPSVWLSKLPDTPLGKRVVSELHEHGLDTEVIWADSDDGRQGLSFHERGADPRPDTTLQDRTDSAAASIQPAELPMGLVQGADAVFVGGSTPALSETARHTTAAVLKACDGARVMDLDYRPGLWSPAEARDGLDALLDEVDVLIASEDDVRNVLGKVGKPREIVHSVAAERDFDRVIVTRSEYGAIAWHDNVIHEEEAVETETVDPAGQHAAFVGAFVRQLIAGEPTETALIYGIAAAALQRTEPGPMTTVTPTEVQHLAAEIGDRGRR